MYSDSAIGGGPNLALGVAAIGAVLFGLDGTPKETDDQAAESMAEALRRLGIFDPHRTARTRAMMAETPINGLLTTLGALGARRKSLSGFRFWGGWLKNTRFTPSVAWFRPARRTSRGRGP